MKKRLAKKIFLKIFTVVFLSSLVLHPCLPAGRFFGSSVLATTFTAGSAKRDAPGPFAAGPVQGKGLIDIR